MLLKRILLFAPLILPALLTGCGGGGSSDLPSDTGGTLTEKRFQQASPPQQASNVVELGDHPLAQGSVTPVTLQIRNPYHLSQISLRLLYDGTKFEAVNPALLPGAPSELKGSVFGEFNVLLRTDKECGTEGTNPRGIAVSISSPSTGVKTSEANETGAIVTLYFRPRAGVPVGAVSALRADYDQSSFRNLNATTNGNPYYGEGYVAEGRLSVGPPENGGLTLPEGQDACSDMPSTPAPSNQNILVAGTHAISKSQPTPVEIRIENPAHILGFQTALEYDSRLFQIVNPEGTELEEAVTAGSVLRGAQYTINYAYYDSSHPFDPSKGRVAFLMSGVTEANRSGKLMTLYFRALPDAPPGASAPLEFYSGYPTILAMSLGEQATWSAQSGTMTVGP